MAIETEHKFLVKNDTYRDMATASYRITQGYLCREPDRTVRVRTKGDKGYLSVKGKNRGATRPEFEYEIGIEDARQLLDLCLPPVLKKTRYIVEHEGHVWEIDEFEGHRAGLVTAEIELGSEGEEYSKPGFVGEDVTGNPAYYNSNL